MREEVQNIKQFVEDSMKAAELNYFMEITEENPDVVAVTAIDKGGYENFGFFGWGTGESMSYAAYDPVRGNHDEAEGISEEDSKCWWAPRDADMMVAFLRGDVRRLMRKVLQEESKRT